MVRQQLCVSVALLVLGVSTVMAAPSKPAARASKRTHRVTRARPAPKAVRTASRTGYRLAARPAGRAGGVRLASARGIGGRTYVRRPLRRTLWAQAATGDGAGLAPQAGSESAAIPREAEPLMIRALGAYYVTGDAAIRDLRARGWSFADIATAGNLAARSGRSLYQVARIFENRRDWTMVARDLNIPADDIYAAINSPRYVMVRPTPEEEVRIAAAPPAGELTPSTSAPGAAAGAATTNTAVAPGAAASPATTAPPAATSPNATLTPGVAVTPEGAATAPAESAVPVHTLTPAERVAASRFELAPREPSAILRRAAATYYVLPSSTVRELEGRGWTLGDILVAGNLANRSEASFEEVVALRDTGQEWNSIAERIGVAPEDLYQPTAVRRVTTVP